MLAYLRDNTGNWIIKFFLGIIVIVFVFLGVGSFGSKNNDTVASIDDQPVSYREYQQAYKQMVDRLRAQFGNNLNDDLLKALNVKQQALNSIIDNRLILNKADELKIQVSDRELQESLLGIKAFQKNGVFDLEQYKTVLRLNSFTPEMFEKSQIDTIRRDRVRQLIVSAVNVSDLEATNWYLFLNKKIAVDYIKFDPSAFKDIQPDEKAVDRFYAEQKAEYKTQPKIKAVYLKFDPMNFKDQVKVTDENAKAFYRENEKLFQTSEKVEARHILIKADDTMDDAQKAKALKQANEIYAKAKNNEDFSTLAKTYSQGPSKDKGGYLGAFDRQSMVKPFSDKAFSMEAGQISEPVKTQFGWHIIKVESRQPASKRSFDTVKDQIIRELVRQEMQNLAYAKADEAFEAVIDGDDFDQVARIVNMKPEATEAFTAQGQGLNMKEKAEFASAAFSLKKDDISDIKQVGNAYYLIQVTEKIEPADQPLEAVKDRVVKDLTRKLQLEAARTKAQAVVEKLKSGKSIYDVAKAGDLKIETTPLFTRNGSVEAIGNSAEFVQAGFTLNPEKKIYPDIIQTADAFYVMAFDRIEIPDAAQVAKNLKEVKRQLSARKQTQAFQTWLTEIKKQHEIVYNSDMINL